jgi:hypothetical protein
MMMKETGMQITITGMVGKRAEKALLKEAAEFFAAQLMDPRMVRNLTIDIEVRKNFDVDGECVNEDGVRNPRWFTIGLKNQDIKEMIKTLGHKMVHVKQHAKNELQSGIMVPARGGVKMTSRWMGQIWQPKAREDAYFDSPWEIEAYGREVGLLAKWEAYKNA